MSASVMATPAADSATIFERLFAPFGPDELEWRVGRSGVKNGKPWATLLAYIDARAARKRLNDVLGPENWTVSYGTGPGNGVIATLSLRINGEWVAKQDGADPSDIEPVKGALSGAFKRACAVWGIGEYIYQFGESWAVFTENGEHSAKIENQYYKWNPPQVAAKHRPALVRDTPAPKPDVPTQPTGAPASDAQRDLLAKLCKSHVITEKERAGIKRKAVDKASHMKAIDWLQTTIEERKAAEKAKALTDGVDSLGDDGDEDADV